MGWRGACVAYGLCSLAVTAIITVFLPEPIKPVSNRSLGPPRDVAATSVESVDTSFQPTPVGATPAANPPMPGGTPVADPYAESDDESSDEDVDESARRARARARRNRRRRAGFRLPPSSRARARGLVCERETPRAIAA